MTSPAPATTPDAALGRARLVAQGLVTRPFTSPAAAVSAHLAMQGQDLPGAIASAALRCTGPDGAPLAGADAVAAVVAELDAGRLVRGYPMRGTVFLMAADDVEWVSELCNAGMLRAAERRRGQLGLTDEHVQQAADIAREVLAGDRGLPRAGLVAHWAEAGIPTEKGAGYHVLAHLIGQRVVCFGPWNGTDQNVVLTSAWLPPGSDLAGRFDGERLPAVAELMLRYLTSHGPATVRDVAWWTKLPLAELRAALPLVAGELASEVCPAADGEARYHRPGLADEITDAGEAATRPLLMPGFDEFMLGYRDRLFALTPDEHDLLVPGNNGVFRRPVVIDGLARGVWRREGRAGRRTLEVAPFGRMAAAHRRALDRLFAAFPFTTP